MVNTSNRSQAYGANNFNSSETQERSEGRQETHSDPLLQLVWYIFYVVQKDVENRQSGFDE